MLCTRVAWVYLVCLLLCKEEGSSPVSSITERRDMGLYEVPLSVSLLGFGIGTMLANFHVWSSKECVCCACDPNERLRAPSICFGCVFVCRKLSPYLGV